MAQFLMLGKYSAEALQGVSAQRTQEAVQLIQAAGGKVESIYALLGSYDLALMVSFQDNSEAMKASLSLAKLTKISFTTFPALAVEEFDKLVS